MADKDFKIFRNPDGSIMRLPKIPVSSLRGMLQSSRALPPTFEEMDEAIAEGAVERFRRGQE